MFLFYNESVNLVTKEVNLFGVMVTIKTFADDTLFRRCPYKNKADKGGTEKILFHHFVFEFIICISNSTKMALNRLYMTQKLTFSKKAATFFTK